MTRHAGAFVSHHASRRALDADRQHRAARLDAAIFSSLFGAPDHAGRICSARRRMAGRERGAEPHGSPLITTTRITWWAFASPRDRLRLSVFSNTFYHSVSIDLVNQS